MSELWHPEGQEGLIASLRRARLIDTDDKGTQQLLKLAGLKSEELDKIVRVGSHGFTSHAPKDSEGILLSLGGRSDRVLALGMEHKDKRIKDLPEGTSVLYDDKGNVVFAKGSGGLEIKTKEGTVVINTDSRNVYLGGDPGQGHQFSKVVTEDGPALNVYARI